MSGSMGGDNWPPFHEPLVNFLYFFNMAATAFYANLFIPAFLGICVNMEFVATFMNESVSYFDSCYLIKNIFHTFLYPNKKITNRSIPALASSPFGPLSTLLKTSKPLSSGNISIT